MPRREDHRRTSTRLFGTRVRSCALCVVVLAMAAAATVETWLYARHVAGNAELPRQLVVCLVALTAGAVSITVVCIWWRMRRIRHASSGSRSDALGRTA